MHYNLLICGVGGRGILTLAEILGRAAVISSGLKTESNKDGRPDWQRELQKHRAKRLLVLDASAILGEQGFSGGQNIYLLGVLCGMDGGLAELLSAQVIYSAFDSVLKRSAMENQELFRRGLGQGVRNRR